MSLNNVLTNTGILLAIFAMTITVFCAKQRESPQNVTAASDADVPPLFEGRLTDVLPDDQAAAVLVSAELIGELLFMLALATGAAGIGLSVLEGIGELFREVLAAIGRLFVLRRHERDIDKPDDPDDDIGQPVGTKPLAPISPSDRPHRPLISRAVRQTAMATS
jgi:hypothetical protein